MPLIDIIAGARPNFMKIAPIIKSIDSLKPEKKLEYRLIHTGQHYDAKMSADFFSQLGIPLPSVNLKAGSGTQAEQTTTIMLGYEKTLLDMRSAICLVVGDVTSTMACAISAQKLQIPVAHVEAGIRSGDWNMPEEINRLVTDSISNYFFTTSEFANENLKKAGISDDRIYFVGNTMIDTLLDNADKMTPPDFWDELSLMSGEYILVTMHRPNNVDDMVRLRSIIDNLSLASRGKTIIFPVHPRTMKILGKLDSLPDNIYPTPPQPYLQFGYLSKHAMAIVTDSGGVTEEATVNGVPCMTLRDTTERPETVSIGTNELIGTSVENIKPAFDKLFDGDWKKGSIPDKWDGKTGQRIVKILGRIL